MGIPVRHPLNLHGAPSNAARASQKAVLAAGMLLLLLAAAPAKGAGPQRVKWDELHTVVGQTVTLAAPGGATITGTATGVDADALAVRVVKTTNAGTYPKGPLRVPRAAVRTLALRHKTSRYRIIGTVVGVLVGAVSGGVAGIAIGGSRSGGGKQGAAFAGIVVVCTAGGYLIGNTADRRVEMIEVVP